MTVISQINIIGHFGRLTVIRDSDVGPDLFQSAGLLGSVFN